MPCRAVVFAGDSPYLNPMNYRQMAGRSGRRGLDLRGQVVFFGIPKHKVRRLLASELPMIQVSSHVPFHHFYTTILILSLNTFLTLSISICIFVRLWIPYC